MRLHAVASTLTITTTAPHAAIARPPNGASVLYAFLFPVAGITLVAIRRRRTGNKLSVVLCAVVCATALFATSCGGSGQSSGSTQLVGGTPRGNYTRTIGRNRRGDPALGFDSAHGSVKFPDRLA